MAEAIERGPLRQATTAFRRLAAATATPPAERWAPADAKVSYGMCGVLRQIDDFRPG